jgi:hypothetical protein
MRFIRQLLVLCVSLLAAAARAEVQLADIERQITALRQQLASLQQQGDVKDGAELERLRAEIDRLAAELSLMQTARSNEPARPAANPGVSPAAARIYSSREATSIGGYGEWLYQAFDDRNQSGAPVSTPNSADLLRIVLYFGHRFDERVVFNSEIEYEHAKAGADSEGEVALEFAYLDFLINSNFNVRTGLVLIPVGLINELHEPPTFLGARRPDVERVILPATWRELGVGAYGDIGQFSYRAYLTTSLDAEGFTASNGIRGGRQEGSRAIAEDWGLSARLDYVGVPGLTVGVSGFRGDSGQGRGFDGSVSVVDAHADFKWRGLQLRGVVARTRIDDTELIGALADETIGSRQAGQYLEAGYDVLAHRANSRWSLSPFVRWEQIDTHDRVASSEQRDPARDREILTCGVSIKPIPNVAIKLDWQKIENNATTGVDQFNAAVGFLF